MRTRIFLFAAIALLAVLPVLAEETPEVDQDQLKVEQSSQVEVEQDRVEPSEAVESASAAALNPMSTGPFEEALASAAANCSPTTSCNRPYNPVWNAYCNNWCQNAGYVAGFCGRNRCCICAVEL